MSFRIQIPTLHVLAIRQRPHARNRDRLTSQTQVFDFDVGDKAEFLESQQPSDQFRAYTQLVSMMALKALDIPYSFYDESFTNYSGQAHELVAV